MTYAGDLTPSAAHQMLSERPNAVLVDVRTTAEWNWVGVPDIEGARFVEWVSWPGGQGNPMFVEAATEGVDPAQPILLLCRSGGRSAAAARALSEAGYGQAYNILEGFEGDIDHNRHRTGGWRGAGLPWRQS